MKPILPVLAIGLFLPYFSFAQPCTPQGDQVTYGTNNVWIGYVYDNLDLTGYSGYVNQGNSSNPDFDQSFGGDNVSYTTNGCPVNTSTFSVRYRLQKTFTNASYSFLVGADDGYRLSIDGGATWLIDRWVDQGYASTSASVVLNGTYDLVLDYYENNGGNRITFNVSQDCTGSENTNIYGSSNVWNGYVYTGTNFNTYKGLVHEGSSPSPNFDQNFGGNNVFYPTSNCNVLTENFSVRYRLTKTYPPGSYRFIVGADDGYRLSLDGGTTWPVTNWGGHSYATTTYTTTLSGSVNIVLEYYESGGDNRVSFTQQVLVLLPVSLLSFSGQEKNGASELKWQITRDSDPAWFEIQRSKDAASFTTINKLQGQAGAVFSSNISYQYSDILPASGTYYYRLRMTDFSGAITYSPVIEVKTGGLQLSTGKVFPTLMNNNTLYLQSGRNLQQAWFTIHDLNGRLVYKRTPGKLDAGQVISVFTGNPALLKGTYILSLRDGDEDISRHRFVVP
jgi:hypothetical protein